MSDTEQNPEKRIALFQRQEIRRTIHNNEWWFVITDVVAALTDSANPTDYLNKVRRRDPELAKGYGQFVHTLLINTPGGPQKLNCANTEGLFRIIQSISSPKAEPFKRWLARVGYERVQEIENPELAAKRTRAIYKAKGYSDDWIEKRMRSIAIRDETNGKALKFNGLNRPFFPDAPLDALRTAEQLPQVKKQDYELRILEASAVYFRAVWLHGESDDIIIPLPETFRRWNAYQPYSESQMIMLLKPEAKKVLKAPRNFN